MWLTIGFFLMASGAIPSEVMSFKDAKELADAHEQKLSTKDAAKLAKAQGIIVERALSDCLSGKSGKSQVPIVVVAKVSASGRVVKTWRDGAGDVALCFQRYVSKSILELPAGKSYFTSFEMDF